MPEEILVIEYEPRYTERVKQALAGDRFLPRFARDGAEAVQALDTSTPRLIVLSSVVPKISTAELIRQIRIREPHRSTPILVTMSGYSGKSPAADAARLGASDILPKPYSEIEFLTKVQSILGIDGTAEETWIGGLTSEFNPRKPEIPKAMTEDKKKPLTSDEIFGDLLTEEKTQAMPRPKPKASSDDLDKILADTLSGVRVPTARKRPGDAPAATPAPAEAKTPHGEAKAKSEFDKRLEDTLSGLEKTVRARPEPAPAPTPAAPRPEPPAPAPAAPAVAPLAQEAPPEKVVQSSPVFPPAAARKEQEEAEAEESGTRFGQYSLLEKIATGGMAEVWKAQMRGVEGFEKIVAIKKILPHLSDNEEFVTMFVDEAKLAAQLNHNNIIHIYDLGRIANSYYIAMEYVDGQDLKTILRRGEDRGHPMPVELALFIASKIASALDYAHRKRDLHEKEMGLVHRDVSPQNVLISHEGDIKLCDFGIAKAASKASHTQAGSLKGKLQYMSPEQAWGRSIDRRSDIFALAAVLFEMLTGRKLFRADNELSILEQVREARVAPPSTINDEVTPEIDAIVLKALQRDPQNRYQTAGEMARDLDAILYGFRPTPTSADLAIYMHRLHSEPVSVAPPPAFVEEEIHDDAAISIKPVPVPVAETAAPAVLPRTVFETPAPAPFVPVPAAAEQPRGRKPPLAAIAAGIVLLAALAVGGYFVTRGKKSAVQAAAQKPAPAAAAVPAPATAPPVPATTTTMAAVTTALTSGDQARIDEEVKKRLEAERLKLEQQQKPQEPAPRTAAAPPPAAAPAPQAASAAPPPVERPAPVTRTEPEPAPQAAAPQVASKAPPVREGDLVPDGTEGLIPPQLVRPFIPRYPELARKQRITGSVVVSALISEKGSVLDARVARGIPLLNEAALEAVRRSTFKPATKDGVRVRAYKTMTIPFKLEGSE